ncbi:MFS transporter [Streptomyces sp. SID13031]|uniref:MFS transporter n=1 Tax=Streptomyces sp. SID13031 TaxID=2706046 RepID=UPI0013CC45A8|nr:MFS transporter [Streptomyces sp. SID13031]NEA37203.1 MFS transporter [Streptomyces sp. SID13031]
MSLLLRHRDFRWFWAGETISRFGSSVSTVALPLIAVSVLQATTFQVGLLSAAAWLPWLLIGLPVGAWVDRWPRRPIMRLASAISLILFASIPLAAHAGLLTIEFLLAVAVLTGAAAVFFQTAYTAYLPNLLASQDQAEGNAKLHGSASAAQIAGVGCGGLIVQAAGAVNGMYVDASTFLIALLCLTAIRYREPRRPDVEHIPLGTEVLAGLRLVAGDVWLRTLTIFGAVSNLGLMGYQSIIVVFLVRELGVSPGMVGALIAIASSGGVVGAFLGRRVANAVGTARATLLFELVLPTLALLIPLTTKGAGLALYTIGAFCIGVGVVAGNTIKATFHQSYCPPELRGRLAASTSFLNYGTIPLGALLGGTLGEVLGLRTALWITTAGIPLAGLVLLCSPIRRSRDLPDHQGSAVPAVAADSSRARID